MRVRRRHGHELGIAEIGLDHRRIVGHLRGVPSARWRAEIEHHDAVREAHDRAHHMLDHQDRDAAPRGSRG